MLDKQIGRDKAEPPSVRTGEPLPPPVPPKKLLPDLTSLGTLSLKPTRPPFVDLSCYYLPTAYGMLTCINVFAFLCVCVCMCLSVGQKLPPQNGYMHKLSITCLNALHLKVQ